MPQRHGGALLRGGVPGNKSKSGRTLKTRRVALAGLLEALPGIIDAAKGKTVTVTQEDGTVTTIVPDIRERVYAGRLLKDVGLPTGGMPMTELKERLTEQQARLLAQLKEEGVPPDAATRIITAVAGAWRD